jgi:Protein of unknown function (DUF3179)
MRWILLGGLLALVAASCGGGDDNRSEGPSSGGAGNELAVSTLGWETDFSKHTVPLGEFMSGGPGKDGIPAIDEPRFVSVADAGDLLADREPVIELKLDGAARAYPLQILVWHEIVNDEVAGIPVAVTFCPLCNTALAFDRRLGDRVLDFSTTGNLRHSDLVMYDRQTESWWQQFGGEAVVGDLAGEKLEQLPARIVAWEDFSGRHPDGMVLSRDTGFSRDYGRNPYAGYDDVDSRPFFPAEGANDDRLLPKERVVFIELGDEAVAVPFNPGPHCWPTISSTACATLDARLGSGSGNGHRRSSRSTQIVCSPALSAPTTSQPCAAMRTVSLALTPSRSHAW